MKAKTPRILVFSTHGISDPGIDLAGSQHLHYPPTALTVAVPCSSAVKPRWILHALERGFDGVFIAADGTDCPYIPDCSERTAALVDRTHALMKERGIPAKRLRMAAVCSVCAESFERQMGQFSTALDGLG
jgi:coenzyme F420-reducing hydrogenase delta subunit